MGRGEEEERKLCTVDTEVGSSKGKGGRRGGTGGGGEEEQTVWTVDSSIKLNSVYLRRGQC